MPGYDAARDCQLDRLCPMDIILFKMYLNVQKSEGAGRGWRDTCFQNLAFTQHVGSIGYISKHPVFGN